MRSAECGIESPEHAGVFCPVPVPDSAFRIPRSAFLLTGASSMSSRKVSADRRDFLKASAAVAGVAASTSFAGAFAAGDEVIKVGLIGCGGRGKGAVEDILQAERRINGTGPKLEIVAVGDVFKSQAEDAVK